MAKPKPKYPVFQVRIEIDKDIFEMFEQLAKESKSNFQRLCGKIISRYVEKNAN